MSSSKSEKNIENSSEIVGSSSSENITINFVSEEGETIAEVEITKEEYDQFMDIAERKDMSFEQLILEALETDLRVRESEKSAEI